MRSPAGSGWSRLLLLHPSPWLHLQTLWVLWQGGSERFNPSSSPVRNGDDAIPNMSTQCWTTKKTQHKSSCGKFLELIHTWAVSLGGPLEPCFHWAAQSGPVWYLKCFRYKIDPLSQTEPCHFGLLQVNRTMEWTSLGWGYCWNLLIGWTKESGWIPLRHRSLLSNSLKCVVSMKKQKPKWICWVTSIVVSFIPHTP